ncbi:alpha/beta fold hydrolase [Sphingomonas glacialis]|nr:alpha/beta hydrolase [Sphingomonas glacialis]
MMLFRALGLVLWLAASLSSSVESTSAKPRDQVVRLSGNRAIAMRCDGRGKFTILLEPGDGGRRTHMAALFAALSTRYRVCEYDRRNVGNSSVASIPRRASDLMSDAFDALTAANEKGPFILFGSSMGGLLVRSYAASHRVAGYVTSNQPGTSAEWGRYVRRLETPAQRGEDDAWAFGGNNEHIDVNDVSRAIEVEGPPEIPHIIMISTERYQCPGAGACGPLYPAYVAASRAAADAGVRGSLRIIDGDHDLYVTNLDAVVAAIDEVANNSSSRH